jgi:hypothetical protein
MCEISFLKLFEKPVGLMHGNYVKREVLAAPHYCMKVPIPRFQHEIKMGEGGGRKEKKEHSYIF